MDVLKDLTEQGQLLHYTNQWYYLFAKTRFANELLEYAKTQENVKLITFEEMNRI